MYMAFTTCCKRGGTPIVRVMPTALSHGTMSNIKKNKSIIQDRDVDIQILNVQLKYVIS